MASKAELVYFNGRGRAEIIRLALAVANIEFSETPLDSRETFLGLAPELLFGQVPLLRIDGLKLVQSASIVRYVCKKANLLGSNDLEVLKADQLFEGSRDFLRNLMGFGFVPDESVVRAAVEKDLTKYFPIYNKVLEENGSTGYLVGSSLTIADIGLFEVIQAVVDYFTEERLKDFPEIVKFYKTLSSLKSIQHYLKDIRKGPNDQVYCSTVAKVLDWEKNKYGSK